MRTFRRWLEKGSGQRVITALVTLCLILEMLPVPSVAYAVEEGVDSQDAVVAVVDDENAAGEEELLEGEGELADDQQVVPADEQPADEQEPADEQSEDVQQPIEEQQPDDVDVVTEDAQLAVVENEPDAVSVEQRTVTFEVKDDEGNVKATIEVEGELPSDATLAVTELDAETAAALATDANDASFAYDVTIFSDGVKWHSDDPEAKLTVRVSGISELPEGVKVLHYITDLTDDEGKLDDEALESVKGLAEAAEAGDVKSETVDVTLTDDGAYEFQLKGLSPLVAFSKKAEEPELRAAAEPTNANEGQGTINGLTYKWSIKWDLASAEGVNLDVDDSTAIFHPTNEGIKTAMIKVELEVNQQGEDGGVIPANAIQFTLPHHVFYSWIKDDEHPTITYDRGGVPVDQVGGYSELVPGGAYSFAADDSDPEKIIVYNWAPIGGAQTETMTFIYRVDPTAINGGHPIAENVNVAEIGKWWMADGDDYSGPSFHEDKEAYLDAIGYEQYYQRSLPGKFELDYDGDGSFDGADDVSVNATLDVAMMTRAIGSALATPMNRTPTKGVYLSWQDAWGTKPDDADQYFYILWNVGYGGGYRANPSSTYHGLYPTQGWLATITADPAKNAIPVGDQLFEGELIGINHKTLRSDNCYPIRSDNLYDAYYWNNDIINGLYGKTANTWRDVRYDGYLRGSSAYQDWFYGSTSNPYATDFAVLMRYPTDVFDAMRELHSDDPNWMYTKGVDVYAEFTLNEHWDSDYDLTRPVPAGPVNVVLEEPPAGGNFSKQYYDQQARTAAGGQTFLLQGKDVSLGGYYNGMSIRSWTMTWNGYSATRGATNLGQHIEMCDTENSVLYISNGDNWQWKPASHDVLEGDKGDYTIKGFTLSVNEYEGTYNPNLGVWSVADAVSTKYDQYAPVEVWVREANGEWYQYYTIQYSKNSSGGRVTRVLNMDGQQVSAVGGIYLVPENTVQIKVKHDSADPFRRCSMTMTTTMTIHPTEKVISNVTAHVEAKKKTYIKDITSYDVWAIDAPDSSAYHYTGSNERGATASAQDVTFILTSLSNSLETSKNSVTPGLTEAVQAQSMAETGRQMSYVVLKAASDVEVSPFLVADNDYEDQFKLLSGTFYDLLPKGTNVKEGSVQVVYDMYHSGSASPRVQSDLANNFIKNYGSYRRIVPKANVTVTTETYEHTGQTMLRVDYHLNDPGFVYSLNRTHIANYIWCFFIVENPMDNVETYGLETENDCGFVNQVPDAGHSRTQSMRSLTSAQLTGEEAFINIAAENDIARFNKHTITWLKNPITETSLNKAVRAVETLEDKTASETAVFGPEATVTPSNEYEYRLTYKVNEKTRASNIVFYDVLDSGSKNGTDVLTSDWRGTFAGLDLSSTGFDQKVNDNDSTGTRKIAPVVYYSTTVTDMNDKDGNYFDLTDTSKWMTADDYETQYGSDLSHVTAFAIDCRLDDAGEPFMLGREQSLVALFKMKAPGGDDIPEGENPTAVNGIISDVTNYDDTSTPTRNVLIKEARVTLRDVDVELKKDSDPKSGTEDEPTQVMSDGTGKITYRLTVTNENPYDITDVVVSDPIPAGLTVTSVEVRLNGSESATPGDSTDGFAYTVNERDYTFTIDQQWPGEENATEILVHCDVDSLLSAANEGTQVIKRDYENTAYLEEANSVSFKDDENPDGIPTDTTYHRAETAKAIIKKEWRNNDNHPTTLDVKLAGKATYDKTTVDQETGDETTETIEVTWPSATDPTAGDATLSEDVSWEHTYIDLPKYAVDDEDADFETATTWGEFVWTASETVPENYKFSVAKSVNATTNTTTFSMVNVFEPQVTDFDFMKRGQGDDVDKLAGATFQLFTDEAATTPLTDDESNTFEATSDSDGKVAFANVPFGDDATVTTTTDADGNVTTTTTATYYMKETAAPAGYFDNTTIYQVELSKDVKEYADGATPAEVTLNKAVITVVSGTQDPNTGDLSGSADEGYVVRDKQKTSVPVDKKWLHANGTDTWPTPDSDWSIKWPEDCTVTVRLKADGTEVADVVLNKDKTSHTFVDLPKYQSDNTTLVTYTLAEDEVPGYVPTIPATAATGDDASNTIENKQVKTTVDVSKAWVEPDGSTEWPDDVESVTINLLADDAKVDSCELTADEPSHTFENLPKYRPGTKDEIVYTIEEVKVEDFATTISGDQTEGYVVTNVRLIDITVEKVWDDADDQDGIRPDSVQIQLYADGEAYDDPIELSEDNDWTYTWKDLLSAKDGVPIVYEVQELTDDVVTGDDAPGTYAISIDGEVAEGFVVTNTHTPEVRDVTVEKAWDDADDQDGIRPKSVKVQLLADGEACGDPVELSEDNSWAYTWEGVDKYSAGAEIEYTVDEVKDDVVTGTDAPGTYAIQVDGDMVAGFVVTNTHTPEVTTVSVSKVWKDSDDKDGIRPKSVQIQLLADGKPSGDPVELSKSNSWAYTWENLPKLADGKDIVYTVDEIKTPVITGTDGSGTYAIKIEGDAVKGFVVTNTHTSVTPPPEKPKIPKTGDILDLATMRVLGAAGAVLAGAGVVLAFVQYLKRKENEE